MSDDPLNRIRVTADALALRRKGAQIPELAVLDGFTDEQLVKQGRCSVPLRERATGGGRPMTLGPTERQAAILARARELDDDRPDHICPGCGRDITGWERHIKHYRPGFESIGKRSGNPFINNRETNLVGLCDWDADHLSARMFRRHYIATYGGSA